MPQHTIQLTTQQARIVFDKLTERNHVMRDFDDLVAILTAGHVADPITGLTVDYATGVLTVMTPDVAPPERELALVADG